MVPIIGKDICGIRLEIKHHIQAIMDLYQRQYHCIYQSCHSMSKSEGPLDTLLNRFVDLF